MAHTFEALGSVYDDFRAVTAGTAISGRTSDSGHTWTVFKGTWSVHANQAGGLGDGNVAASQDNETFVRCGIDFGSADGEVEVTVNIQTPDNLGGLMFRRNASGYYLIRGTGAQAVGLHKVTDAGTATLLATGADTLSELSVVKAVLSGSTITGYVDGVEQFSVNDSTYNGTVHGMWQTFGGNTNVSFYAFNMHPRTTPPWTVGSVRW